METKKQIQKEERERVLELIKLKIICRTRGLKVDVSTQEDKEYFLGAKEEFETFLRHLSDKNQRPTLRWIKADIECAKKYLSDKEKKLFKELKQEDGNSSQA